VHIIGVTKEICVYIFIYLKQPYDLYETILLLTAYKVSDSCCRRNWTRHIK